MGGTVLEFSADKVFNAGVEKGREEGREECWKEGYETGLDEAYLANIRTVMKKMKYTAKKAMDLLELTEQEQAKYTSILKGSEENEWDENRKE